jgi:Tfp pilus assembly protein PilF
MRDARFLLPVLLLGLLAGCAGSGGPRPARLDHASVPELIALADSSLAQGQAEDARKYLKRALDLDPQDAKVHDALGRLHAATRRYLDAKNEFERAAALDTTSAEPLYHLGQAYAQAGDPARAAEAYSRALARDPGHLPSQTALATVLGARYAAAGLPQDYGALRAHPSISRGELGVMLAAELGASPDRPSFRSGTDRPSDTEEARDAWGERWLRVSIARGWIEPYPDGSYHLGDPVTRGTLALLATRIAGPASSVDGSTDPFTDVGARHYLARAARTAASLGLPARPGERFEPWASVTGAEAISLLRGLARRLGVEPVVSGEQRGNAVVK